MSFGFQPEPGIVQNDTSEASREPTRITLPGRRVRAEEESWSCNLPFAVLGLIQPYPPINPIEPQGGSWSVNYTFRQYIVERSKKDGWGFFGQVSLADQATSPITNFLSLGIGGNGLFERRPRDEFGIAYAYTELSDVLKDNIDLLPLGGRRPRPENQVEMFYNFHITPWLRLMGDLQIIHPTRPNADTAIIPGIRLEVKF